MRQLLLFEAKISTAMHRVSTVGAGCPTAVFGVDLSRVVKIRMAAVASYDDGQGEVDDYLDQNLAELAAVFGEGEESADASTLGLTTADGGLLWLRVARVRGVATAYEGEMVPLPTVFGARARQFFPNVLIGKDGPALLLDLEGNPSNVETRCIASLSTWDLDEQIQRKIASEAMREIVEDRMRQLADKAAMEGMARIKRALKQSPLELEK